MSVVDGARSSTAQPLDSFDHLLAIPQFQMFAVKPDRNPFADQLARYRILIVLDPNHAVARDATAQIGEIGIGMDQFILSRIHSKRV